MSSSKDIRSFFKPVPKAGRPPRNAASRPGRPRNPLESESSSPASSTPHAASSTSPAESTTPPVKVKKNLSNTHELSLNSNYSNALLNFGNRRSSPVRTTVLAMTRKDSMMQLMNSWALDQRPIYPGTNLRRNMAFQPLPSKKISRYAS